MGLIPRITMQSQHAGPGPVSREGHSLPGSQEAPAAVPTPAAGPTPAAYTLATKVPLKRQTSSLVPEPERGSRWGAGEPSCPGPLSPLGAQRMLGIRPTTGTASLGSQDRCARGFGKSRLTFPPSPLTHMALHIAAVTRISRDFCRSQTQPGHPRANHWTAA